MKIPQDLAKKIANREITGRDAAKLLSISEQYISVLIKAQKIIRIPGPTVIQREQMQLLTATRREFRKRLIQQVKSGKKTIADAAKEARCSERTIYRYL